jgi:hypothetical protein
VRYPKPHVDGASGPTEDIQYIKLTTSGWTGCKTDTLITAFPNRHTQTRRGQNIDLITHIDQVMRSDDLPQTMDSMIAQFVLRLVGFVDEPHNAGLDENVFDIFEQSIADCVRLTSSAITSSFVGVTQCSRLSSKRSATMLS